MTGGTIFTHFITILPYQTKQCPTKVKKLFEGDEKLCPMKKFVKESLYLQVVLLDKSDEIC